jgi:hypothetical protein
MDDDAEAQFKCETYLNMQKEGLNNDDINMISDGIASIVKTNSKVSTSNEYCSMARLTNPEQSHISNYFQCRISSNILHRTSRVWRDVHS